MDRGFEGGIEGPDCELICGRGSMSGMHVMMSLASSLSPRDIYSLDPHVIAKLPSWHTLARLLLPSSFSWRRVTRGHRRSIKTEVFGLYHFGLYRVR